MYRNLHRPLLFLFFSFVSGFLCSGGEDAKLYSTIYVAQSGLAGAHFTTIQSAIDSIPSHNTRWIRISIMPGTYKEKVTIPSDKPYIYLKGEGVQRPSIVWGDSDSIIASPTFTSHADNIKVEYLQFVNSYNYPPGGGAAKVKPAVAAMITGDKTAFYWCGFSGVQDTLLDATGRHYFKRCTIEGATDFIFGAGQTIYEECTIVVNAGSIGGGGITGFITAQGRSGGQDSNAFVFKNCIVTGNGRAYLGRAWRSYARTIFFNSSLPNIIVPQGWDAWYSKGYEKRLTFAEVGCYGEGSDTSNRVSWEAHLSPQLVNYFTSINFIDIDRWINRQPY
ncbi:hypothetical protein DM860_003317 [Cuscuta australis]|uniref:Pectinesterase n=1 Tax=Cuscuta australis TaxID=267555 RepID=A0A328DIU5_9ASTE|nr:hypothetical protein DM860_003317 [Cuscuta australis]